MINIATLSDSNYLIYGINLYKSIAENTKTDFILHYLCIDDTTYEKLYNLKQKNNWQNLRLWHFNTVKRSSDWNFLQKNTQNKAIDHSDGQSTFHWALASVFTNILMEIIDRPFLYVDSDICFYNDINIVFSCLENKSVGLITHKHISPNTNSFVGYFNVGVIYFNNDEYGKACLEKWKNCVIGIDQTYKDFGTCGDQKYLELFDQWIPSDKILILDTVVGHSAPWCAGHHEIIKKKNVHYLKWPAIYAFGIDAIVEQPLIFFHFSHFTPNYINNTWKKDRNNEWCGFLGQLGMTELYQEYFEKCKQWI